MFQLGGQAGIDLLDRWLAWVQRCRIESFVELGRGIKRHRAAIDQTLLTGTGNALVESTIIYSPETVSSTSLTRPREPVNDALSGACS